jgi:hypothetical protein
VFARLHTLATTPEQAERGLEIITSVFLPWARESTGFRGLLRLVDIARRALSRIRSPWLRNAIALSGALAIYRPLVGLGTVLRPFGLGASVPLYEVYRGKSVRRIRQDVYDRFFTRIEQRVSRAEIEELGRDFGEIRISDALPYWHFLLTR